MKRSKKVTCILLLFYLIPYTSTFSSHRKIRLSLKVVDAVRITATDMYIGKINKKRNLINLSNISEVKKKNILIKISPVAVVSNGEDEIKLKIKVNTNSLEKNDKKIKALTASNLRRNKEVREVSRFHYNADFRTEALGDLRTKTNGIYSGTVNVDIMYN